MATVDSWVANSCLIFHYKLYTLFLIHKWASVSEGKNDLPQGRNILINPQQSGLKCSTAIQKKKRKKKIALLNSRKKGKTVDCSIEMKSVLPLTFHIWILHISLHFFASFSLIFSFNIYWYKKGNVVSWKLKSCETE